MRKNIRAIDRHGRSRPVAIQSGCSLMEALRDSGLPVAAICGGAKSCATCHVYLEAGDFRVLASPMEEEVELLAESAHFRPGASRLSCQVRAEELASGAVVTLAPEDL